MKSPNVGFFPHPSAQTHDLIYIYGFYVAGAEKDFTRPHGAPAESWLCSSSGQLHP